MEYTKIPDSYEVLYHSKFKGEFDEERCKEDPTVFAYFMLGKKLRIYQSYLIDSILDNHLNVWCLPRQLGKTIAIAAIALWATYYNKIEPTTEKRISDRAEVYIMSRTDDQAKEVLTRIRDMVYDGDAHMFESEQSSSEEYFSSQLGAPNNVYNLSFKGKGHIKCVPPTGQVRGKSADWFFIDEAAFLKHPNPDKLFTEDVEPTISKTYGRIIVSSTPNGQQGFFFKILDPYDKFPKSEFKRMWFHYSVFQDMQHLNAMTKKEERLRAAGEGKSFEQEYEAKFTSSLSTFFDAANIDKVVNPEYGVFEDKEHPCVVGIDFGKVTSRSAIAVSYYNSDESRIITSYVKQFPKGYALNDIPAFVEGLMERFRVEKIIPDECPEGYAVIEQLEAKGWNIEPFNFNTKKIPAYSVYRSKLNTDRVGVLNDNGLIMEMKGLQQKETLHGRLKIEKGGGLNDDMIDAVIMSASQWLTEDSEPYELVLV